MDQRSRKLMTVHKALHVRDYIDIIYASRKEGGRGVAKIQDSIHSWIRRLEDYIKKSKEKLLTVTRNNTFNAGSTEQRYPENQNVT